MKFHLKRVMISNVNKIGLFLLLLLLLLVAAVVMLVVVFLVWYILGVLFVFRGSLNDSIEFT